MDPSAGQWNPTTMSMPNEGITARDPRLLPQPTDFFSGAHPWPSPDECGMVPPHDKEPAEHRPDPPKAKTNGNKTREVVRLKGEVAALRAAKEQCQAELTRMYEMARCQQQQTEELQQCLLDARQQLREKDEYIQSRNSMMSRVKEHLEVIAEGLDENNSMSRRMLLNLTAQFF